MGTSSRGTIVNKQQADLPGPGMYTENVSTIGKNAPKFTFSTKCP